MSDYARSLAASWRKEIEEIEARIPLFEAGTMRLTHNYVDVTQEHIASLKRMIEELRKGIAILKGDAPTT